MVRKISWTMEEDKVLVQAFKASPQKTKNQRYKDASEKLFRSEAACAARWHRLNTAEYRCYLESLAIVLEEETKASHEQENQEQSKTGFIAKVLGFFFKKIKK